MKQPFTMTVSPRCVSYYVVGLDTEGQEIYQGRGRCHECRVNTQVDISTYHLYKMHNTQNLRLCEAQARVRQGTARDGP